MTNIRAMVDAVHENAQEGALTTRTNLPTPRVQELPGGRAFGFGGFCSPIPGRYERALARHCTREFLEVCGVIEPRAGGPAPEFGAADERHYRDELRHGLELLGDRLREMVQQTHLIEIFPGLDAAVLRIVAGEVERAIRQLADETPTHARYEIRVHVPDRHFELDGRGLGDRDLASRRLSDGRWSLVTELEVDAAGRWRGPHLDVEAQRLTVHRAGALPGLDRRFCTIDVPPSKLLAAATLLPNPIFEVTVKASDAGRHLDAEDIWSVSAGVMPLEQWIAATAAEVIPAPASAPSSRPTAGADDADRPLRGGRR
jgi:hypothetical protein